jgi:hypothetical protein
MVPTAVAEIIKACWDNKNAPGGVSLGRKHPYEEGCRSKGCPKSLPNNLVARLF